MFDSKKPLAYDDIIGPLLNIREILMNDYHSLYLKDLDHFMDKVRIFKTHFATLDIRQDHSKHKLAIEHILQQKGLINESIGELSDKRLTQILMGGLYSGDNTLHLCHF